MFSQRIFFKLKLDIKCQLPSFLHFYLPNICRENSEMDIHTCKQPKYHFTTGENDTRSRRITESQNCPIKTETTVQYGIFKNSFPMR